MDEIDKPLTEIEQSRADTGYRYYACEKSIYGQLAAAVDASRGYPKQFTKRGLPLVEKLPESNDGSGKILIAIDCWRFTPDDEAMLAPAIQAGLIEELTKEEFDGLLEEESEQPISE